MKSLRGQLLLASPQLEDPNFAHAVVLMVQHDENGALGLILNRPLEMTVKEALEQSGDETCAQEEVLHQGGPCDGPLMVIHTHESVAQIEVLEGVYFSTERDNVEWLLEYNQGPIKFFLGYAGWSAGQLEAELEAGGWLLTSASAKQIFAGDEGQWLRLNAQITLGPHINPKIIPVDPRLN